MSQVSHCVRTVGRPRAEGKAVGLKPYLSEWAIALLDAQPSRSQYVANLIEREADQSALNNPLHGMYEKLNGDFETSRDLLKSLGYCVVDAIYVNGVHRFLFKVKLEDAWGIAIEVDDASLVNSSVKQASVL